MAKINTVAKMDALDIADEIVDAVRAAVARGEDGITFKEAREITGLSYHHTYGAVNELHFMGKIQIASRADRITRYIVLPDWKPPAKLELTALQQAALDYLVSIADGAGIAYASYGEIAGNPGRGRHGGTYFTVETLDKKGFLSILLRGRGARRTMFRVYPDGNGPSGYSPFHSSMLSKSDLPQHLGIPRPGSFAEWCPGKTVGDGVVEYGRSPPVIRRWFSECGVEPAKVIRIRKAKERKAREAALPVLLYPFIAKDRDSAEHRLMKRVSAAVPAYLPPDRRADICQDIIVAILSGDIEEADIEVWADEFTRQTISEFPTKFGDLSLDAPMGDTDLRLIDTLSTEDSIWLRA